jgi:transcriptional regulator with XRE-family HTH domain
MNNEYENRSILIELRKHKGKTIAEMAYESGLSGSSISHYERGVRVPDGKALIKLAHYFNVSTDYLLGLDTDKNKEESNTRQENLSRLNECFNTLPVELRGPLMEVMTLILTNINLLPDASDLTKLLIELNNHFYGLAVKAVALRDGYSNETYKGFINWSFSFLSMPNEITNAFAKAAGLQEELDIRKEMSNLYV